MSLYNMLFGTNPQADILLATLGITKGDVPRFRDCYLDAENKRIAIYTRTGGGNRESYELEIEQMRDLPGFITDSDDSFDCTYMTFYYSFPEDYKAELEALATGDAAMKPGEKWQELFKRMEEWKVSK